MASRLYSDKNPLKAAEIAISMIMFKLEGQLIQRNPDFHMTHRMLLNFIDFDNSTIELNGKKLNLAKKEDLQFMVKNMIFPMANILKP